MRGLSGCEVLEVMAGELRLSVDLTRRPVPFCGVMAYGSDECERCDSWDVGEWEEL